MINAGRLDRRLKLLSPVAATDEFGQQIAGSYPVMAVIWGERLDIRTQDAARLGERDSFAVTRYRIRYRPDIRTTMRVEADGKLHDVVGVEEIGRRAEMVLTVEEVTR